ncbi:protein kinase [Streptomyces sp. 7-21]|jgi:tRNA A-37 threonylcarbamoyl transferase component Bud32|uniref:protein kinase domain-containing protein n=1 Tax=Streptomyces sp. 7-21 TaxID=2802283 RepID=UPI00191F41C4|nr:protein kinase [Streptomyces sp. 7-21]MBL1066045.1 protein kinase [Streptomyces sp. 7-21]
MSDQGAPTPGGYAGRSVGGGRYQLRDLLGKGGMASVHLAWDTVLERQVAIKTMHADLGREDAFRERFKREAQSVAKLTHTNIVSVFDTGEDVIDGVPVPYIVMEYVEGRPLRAVLEEDVKRFGAMTAERALSVTDDVLAALEISHEMGLVHRDIKPGNVMITRRGVVKVMDFGIARAMQSGVTSMTQTGMVVGTPQYLSPEQALGRGVDARSDLYSVGVMLFELLTGRLPFDSDSPLAIAYAHVQEEPPLPSSINTAVPPAVDALVMRAMRKNPNERFSSAEEFRAECQRVTGTLTGATPRIVPGAHEARDSGAAVAQAVFPQFGAPAPPTPASPYGPATPAPGGSAYGYPGGTTGPVTPPYHLTTQPPAPPAAEGKRSTTLMVALASVIAIAVVAAVAIVVVVNSGGGNGGENTEADGENSSTVEPGNGENTEEEQQRERRFREGDPSKTIDPEECTEAGEYWDQEEEPGALMMPDFYDVHIDSAKECIRAAGWVLDEDLNYRDEVLKGRDMVVDQSPAAGDPYNPEEDGPIELTVSTGQEAVRG